METKTIQDRKVKSAMYNTFLKRLSGVMLILVWLCFFSFSTFAKQIDIISDDAWGWGINYYDYDWWWGGFWGDWWWDWWWGAGSDSTTKSDKDFPYTYDKWTPTSDIGKVVNQTNQNGSLLEDYLDLFWINYSGENWKAITYVQIVINYVLALLWIISVVLILYSFYSIFFSSKSEEAVQNARKTVVWATIGLILVGLSAYIVNFIFYIYNRGI